MRGDRGWGKGGKKKPPPSDTTDPPPPSSTTQEARTTQTAISDSFSRGGPGVRIEKIARF